MYVDCVGSFEKFLVLESSEPFNLTEYNIEIRNVYKNI